MNVEGSKRRDRLKKRWLDMIKSDLRTAGECVGDERDCVNWRFRA